MTDNVTSLKDAKDAKDSKTALAKSGGPKVVERTKGAAKEPKAPKAPSKPKEKTIAKFPYNSTIVLLTDKEGKKYGPDNNPKRSTAAKRFALYKDGMTIQQALDAGVKPQDISWDYKNGKWIDIRPPVQTASASA